MLTDTGFVERKAHFLKLFNVLKAIYKNKSVSKWDLAKIGNKEGYVPYSWVLVHKLMNELKALSLIKPLGVRKVTEESRKKGKKHDTPIFGVTKKGLVLLLMLDKKTYESYSSSIIRQKNTGDSIWLLCDSIWSIEYVTPINAENYNIPIRSRIIKLILDAKTVDIDIEDILMDGLLYNIIDITKYIVETSSSKIHITGDTITNMVYLLNVENILSGIQFHNKDLYTKLTDQLLAKILVLELHQEIMKKFWYLFTTYDWPSSKPIIEVRNAILKSLGDLNTMMLQASLQRQAIYGLADASQSGSTMNPSDTDKMLPPEFKKGEELKNRIISDFQKSLSAKNTKNIVDYVTNNVNVEVEGTIKFSGKGISFIKKWIDTLPKNVLITDSGILFDEITSLIRAESKSEIIIYNCSMGLRRDKITYFKIYIKNSKDLKYEKKILGLQSPDSDKYAKMALSILQKWYEILSPKY